MAMPHESHIRTMPSTSLGNDGHLRSQAPPLAPDQGRSLQLQPHQNDRKRCLWRGEASPQEAGWADLCTQAAFQGYDAGRSDCTGARRARCLAECDSEWVVRLHTAFQDSTSLYLLMDYIPGGNLAGLRRHHGRFREDAAVFYAAELILAIEAVHTLGYIHRDIKPENVLINHDGHLKLVDFGLAKSDREQHDGSYYAALRVPCVPKSPTQSGMISSTEPVDDREQPKKWTTSSHVGTL